MKVNKSLTLSVPADRAFRAFTEDIGRWWPLPGFSFGDQPAEDMILEGKVGGRLYQRFPGGTEYVIGEVRAFEPPSRVVFTWSTPDWKEPTEVEVRFSEKGGATKVDLEHRGFEALGDAAQEAHGTYDGGWVEVLRFYEKHAAA